MANQQIPVGMNQLLKLPIVERLNACSRSNIYRKIQNGLITRPVQLGGNRVAWPASEIKAIIDARIAGKTDHEIKLLVIELEAARGQK